MISLLKEILAVGQSAHERDQLLTVLHMGSSGACYNGNDENYGRTKGIKAPLVKKKMFRIYYFSILGTI